MEDTDKKEMSSFTISFEGNIGCGKTTLIEKLAHRDVFNGARVKLEPVAEWEEHLARAYTDPKRHSLAMNLKALMTVSAWKDGHKGLTLCERSPVACKEVFSRVQFKRGELAEHELRLLDEAHGLLGWIPDLIVYLSVSPETCQARMLSRGRGSEMGVSRDYLSMIHKNYEDLFSTFSACPVICIDASSLTTEEIISILETTVPKFLANNE